MIKEKKCQLIMKIDSVVIKKNKIICTIDSKEYVISNDTYSKYYLYPNKELSEEEFNSLILDSKLEKAKGYVIRLLTKSRYTFWDIRDKVSSKFKLCDTEIDTILNPYVSEGVIDDYHYALEYIQSKNNLCYGKRYFINKLKGKGIESQILNKEDITSAMEYNNQFIPCFIDQLAKKAKDKPNKKKISYITSFLVNRGFDLEVIKGNIGSFSFTEEKEVEQKLEKKADLIYKQLEGKSLNKNQIREKMIKKLLYYGYDYDNIIQHITRLIK